MIPVALSTQPFSPFFFFFFPSILLSSHSSLLPDENHRSLTDSYDDGVGVGLISFFSPFSLIRVIRFRDGTVLRVPRSFGWQWRHPPLLSCWIPPIFRVYSLVMGSLSCLFGYWCAVWVVPCSSTGCPRQEKGARDGQEGVRASQGKYSGNDGRRGMRQRVDRGEQAARRGWALVKR